MVALFAERCLSHLAELPFVQAARWLGPTAPEQDGVVELQTPTGTLRLRAEIKRTHLSYDLADRVISAMRRDPAQPWLLLARSIGAPLGAYLAERKVNFVDQEGNCFLELGGQYVARISGRTAPSPPPRDRGVRAAGYQVLFALLARPDLVDATVRVIAEAAGVSRHAAATMVQRLLEDGMLTGQTRGGRRWVPYRVEDAIDRWLVGYADSVRPRLLIGRYRTRDADPAALAARLAQAFEGVPWRLGGAAAAHRLGAPFRGPHTVVHVRDEPPDLPRKLGAAPDPSGPLVLLRVPGPVAFEGLTQDTVHPLLVYSEMMVTEGERGREAAGEILQHCHVATDPSGGR